MSSELEVTVTISYRGTTTATRVMRESCGNPSCAAVRAEACILTAGREASAMIAGALGDVRDHKGAPTSALRRPLGPS